MEGNLAGESESQMFLTTKEDAPVSLSVVRRPDMEPEWASHGLSWSISPPSRRSRTRSPGIASPCFLPEALPYDSILSTSGSSRVLVTKDYRYVLDQLGACARTRGGPPKIPGT